MKAVRRLCSQFLGWPGESCKTEISQYIENQSGFLNCIGCCDGSLILFTVMNLVLVYAGTPTIFANFRTFIRLYFTIFHGYIAPLHCSSTSQSYVALYRTNVTSHPKSRLAPWHRHCLMSLHMTCQVLGPSQAARSTTP